MMKRRDIGLFYGVLGIYAGMSGEPWNCVALLVLIWCNEWWIGGWDGMTRRS